MKLIRFLRFLLISGHILMPVAFKAVISDNKKKKDSFAGAFQIEIVVTRG